MNEEISNLAKTLIKKASKNKTIIATSESCTGGLISSAITSIDGSSAVFDRSFITYSNNAKTQMLRVCQAVLEEYGAVSEQVAKQMAIGAVKHSEANLAVSITGVAGPTGGTDKKPVGLVYIGLFHDGWSEAKVTKNNFSGDRNGVREKTTLKALELLINES